MARTRKFITHAAQDRIKKYPPEVQSLLMKGKEQKFVTQQELMGAIPNAEDNLEFLMRFTSCFLI